MSNKKKVVKAAATRSEVVPLPVYDTLSQCAAQTGIPKTVLSKWRKDGNPGFRHGRVHLGDALRHAYSKGDGDTDWKADKQKSDALMARIDLEKANRAVIDFATVDRFLTEIIERFIFGALSERDQRLPGVLKGMDEVTICAELTASTEEIKGALRNKLQEIKKHEHKV